MLVLRHALRAVLRDCGIAWEANSLGSGLALGLNVAVGQLHSDRSVAFTDVPLCVAPSNEDPCIGLG